MILRLVSNSILRRSLNQTAYLGWRQRGGFAKNSINRLKDFNRDTIEVKDRAIEGSIDDMFTLGMTHLLEIFRFSMAYVNESMKVKRVLVVFVILIYFQSFLPDLSRSDLQAVYNENSLEAKLMANQPGSSHPGSVK